MDISIYVNFAIATSVLTLTSIILGLNLSMTRCIVLSTVYAIFLSIFDGGNHQDITFALLSIFVSLGASHQYDTHTTILYVLTYVAIATAIEIVSNKLTSIYHSSIVTPLIIAMSTIIITGLVWLTSRLIKAHNQKQKNTYKTEIIFGKKSAFSLGFYDSGNTAKHNGTPIVILPDEIAKQLDFCPTDTAHVMTIGGIKTLRIAPVNIKVYYEDGTHIVYAAMGATSNFCKKSSVLLNAEMRR